MINPAADNCTQLAEEVQKLIRGVVKTGEPMARHTTFGIGGPADIYVEPADADDLAAVMAWVHSRGLPWFVLGDGANCLVSDKGIRGVVIRMGKPFAKVKIDGERVIVGSGAKLDKLISLTTEMGLGGLESAAAIPGTVGGAIVMNAGTYRGQIGDVVEVVRVVTDEGKKVDMTPEELQFRYRWSVFQEDKSKIIVDAVLHLKPADRNELVRAAEFVRQRRGTNLPTGKSAGCVFKNPDGKSAGQLIDEAGLKGLRIGGAVISDKHANFILNAGSAKAEDVRILAERVRSNIKEKFDVDLIYEVRIVGDW